jgi:hypothetical protein
METKHTPIKAPIRIQSAGLFTELVDADGKHIMEVFDDGGVSLSQAEFIVRAVNSFDSLVEACRAARDRLKRAHQTNYEGDGDSAYEMCCAALSKAEVSQ